MFKAANVLLNFICGEKMVEKFRKIREGGSPISFNRILFCLSFESQHPLIWHHPTSEFHDRTIFKDTICHSGSASSRQTNCWTHHFSARSHLFSQIHTRECFHNTFLLFFFAHSTPIHKRTLDEICTGFFFLMLDWISPVCEPFSTNRFSLLRWIVQSIGWIWYLLLFFVVLF